MKSVLQNAISLSLLIGLCSGNSVIFVPEEINGNFTYECVAVTANNARTTYQIKWLPGDVTIKAVDEFPSSLRRVYTFMHKAATYKELRSVSITAFGSPLPAGPALDALGTQDVDFTRLYVKRLRCPDGPWQNDSLNN